MHIEPAWARDVPMPDPPVVYAGVFEHGRMWSVPARPFFRGVRRDAGLEIHLDGRPGVFSIDTEGRLFEPEPPRSLVPAPRRPLRVRIGPRSWLARAWAWLVLPRIWPRCARCGEVREEFGVGRLPRGTHTVCQGVMPPLVAGGQPWCLHLGVRHG